MAKSKKLVDLKHGNFTFTQKDETIKLLNFNQNSMDVEVAIFKNDKFVKNSKMAFAHLPKNLKIKLNPKA
ncbi:malate dehydrogenase [Aliarcobacter vitoriensis]|uniref:malate dehydrogenase n=1 Tax=Aliarcobacter vitoriensis TaxID=2011099 RepID=UPI003AB0C102